MPVETLDEMRGSGVTREPLPADGVHMGDGPIGPLRSRRLLRLAGDARLVEQVRRGNEAAFEVVFERHGPPILAFCRHMLGSPEEAEDAVQHTFTAAYRDLRSGDRRRIALKPWLFTIARNRCVSVLRARRELPVEDTGDVATEGLAEEVERRAELRRVVADVRDLPDEQRAALLLTEVGDLSHAEVAGVLGCGAARVKALVYRARSQLIARRNARETGCEEIREQLATLRGGALRRSELRLHLRECPGCRAYRDDVRRQRELLAVALPVAPAIGLKSSVLAAVGIGGSAGGATGLAGVIGGATVAKVAVVSALAGGGVVAGEAVVESDHPIPARPVPAQPAPDADEGSPAGTLPGTPARSGEDSAGREGLPPGRALGGERGKPDDRAARARGRGPIAAPPGTTPVRRGPPDEAGRPGVAESQKARGQGNAKHEGAKPTKPATPANGRPQKSGEGTRANEPSRSPRSGRPETPPVKPDASAGRQPASRGSAGALDGAPLPAGTVAAPRESGDSAAGMPRAAPELD
jgi:RNA polymerase sigma factor (sigma-70 family)